jgi:hypothetical protein
MERKELRVYFLIINNLKIEADRRQYEALKVEVKRLESLLEVTFLIHNFSCRKRSLSKRQEAVGMRNLLMEVSMIKLSQRMMRTMLRIYPNTS